MLAGSEQTLTALPAAHLAALARRREVSPTEIVEAHLERIQALNPDLNAIVTLRAEEARRDAIAADHALRAGEGGLLCGVPFTVKDTIATAGVRTTCGSRTMAEHIPAYDATAVGRLKTAGAILLGKTNCPEFGFGVHTWNALFGETKSPFGDVTPGGSSGGESAAIAAGCSPLGLGTDYGGSLRWPAHCTGIVGLRPTVGRVAGTGQLLGVLSLEPAIPNEVSLQGRLQVVGPLARTVEDIELALRVIAGPDGLDPVVGPVDLDPSDTVGSIRAAWCIGEWPMEANADVVSAVEWAAGALADAGVPVEHARPAPLEYAPELYTQLRDLDGLDAPPVAQLWARRNLLRADLLRFLDEHHVLVLPVGTTPAPRIASHDPEAALAQWDFVQPSRAISLFGLPALAVAASRTDDGRPVGVQVVGRPFREDEVIAVGRLIETSQAERTR